MHILNEITLSVRNFFVMELSASFESVGCYECDACKIKGKLNKNV